MKTLPVKKFLAVPSAEYAKLAATVAKEKYEENKRRKEERDEKKRKANETKLFNSQIGPASKLTASVIKYGIAKGHNVVYVDLKGYISLVVSTIVAELLNLGYNVTMSKDYTNQLSVTIIP